MPRAGTPGSTGSSPYTPARVSSPDNRNASAFAWLWERAAPNGRVPRLAHGGRNHPDDGSLPEGQLHHFAGPTDDGGWIICPTWDSRESWERFREDIVILSFQELGDEGLPGEFQETTYEVANELHA